MNMFFLLLLSTVGLAASPDYKDAPECEGRPDFITEVRPQIIGSFEKLPPLLLIASEAEYYVESKDLDLKIHSYQSFKNADVDETKVICGSAAKSSVSSRFSLFAPTVIDTTPNKSVGQSLWHFQTLSGPSGISARNRRSLALVQGQSLDKNMIGFGGNYRLYQLGPKQYEIVVSKSSGNTSQYLSIKFDAVPSL